MPGGIIYMEEKSGEIKTTCNFQLYPKVKNLCVLEEVVSLKCSSSQKTPGLLDFLQSAINKDYLMEVKLESVQDKSLFTFWDCKIRSINIQEEVHFVIHFMPVDLDKTQKLLQILQVGRLKLTILKLLEIEVDRNKKAKGKDKKEIGPKKAVGISATSKNEFVDKNKTKSILNKDFSSDQTTASLEELLEKLSRLTGKQKEQLIEELTSFKTKDGKYINGKKTLDEVSEKQKIILVDKIKRQINRLESGA